MRVRLPSPAVFGVAAIVVLTLLLAVHVLLDRSPLTQDSLGYYRLANGFAQALAAFNVREILNISDSFRPPLVGKLAALGLLIGRPNPDPRQAILIVVLFYALLAFSVAAVVARACPEEPPATPWLAAFVVATSPAMMAFGQTLMLDLPLAAVFWAALALLARTELFRRPSTSLLFGVVCGLGMLTKQPFALFIAGPALLVAARAVTPRLGRRRALAGVGLAAAAAAALALPWYIPNFWKSLIENTAGSENMPTDVRLFKPWLTLSWLWNWQLGWVDAALAGAGLARLLATPALRRRYAALLTGAAASGAAPFLFFAASPIKHYRLTLPFVPFFAICLALGLFAETGAGGRRAELGARLRRVGVAATIVFGLFQFACCNFSPSSWNGKDPQTMAALDFEAPAPWLWRAMGIPPYPLGSHLGLSQFNTAGENGLFLFYALENSAWPFQRARQTPVRVLLEAGDDAPHMARDFARCCRLAQRNCEIALLPNTETARARLAASPDLQAWFDVLVEKYPQFQSDVAPDSLRGVLGGRVRFYFGALNRDGHLIVSRNIRPDAAAVLPPDIDRAAP
jgi:4-amino-4-deoxy-L-arabinose transferase-like glycosyltransferase